MSEILTVERLRELVTRCLFHDDELPADGSRPADAVLADGVRNTFGYHPQRLNAAREEVRALLLELPHGFRQENGGGWTFLNAHETHDGRHWGEHADVEALLCLGLALGLARYCLPRDVWPHLPGGMPYFALTLGTEVPK